MPCARPRFSCASTLVGLYLAIFSRFSISLATGTRSTSTPTNLPNAGDVAARKTTSHSNRMATPSCYGSMWPVYPVRTDDANGLDGPLVGAYEPDLRR